MYSVNSLQPAISMSVSPVMDKDHQFTLAPRMPSPAYVASRVHSIANCKLRLEASQNEPRLRKLLGHIFVYDAIRDHQRSQAPTYTTPLAQRRREQQLRRHRQMCDADSESSSSLMEPSITEDDSTSHSPSDNASDIQAYLSTIPSSIPSSQAYDFTTFQHAIAQQLATLSQVRIEAASRQLYHMTQDEDDADESAVEEYASSDDDAADSDYDSCDGDSDNGNDWSDDNDGGWVFDHPANTDSQDDDVGGDSDTDPDSINSAPPSPTGDFGSLEKPSRLDETRSDDQDGPCYNGLPQVSGGSYFLPLRPVPQGERQ